MRHEFINNVMVIYVDETEVFTFDIGDGNLKAIAERLSTAPRVVQKYILSYLGIDALTITDTKEV